MSSNLEEMEELQDKMEQLQLDYEEKCGELVERENDLKAAKMQIEELRILLKSGQTGDRRSSMVPDTMGAGGSQVVGNPQAEELRRMFLWLAEKVVLEEPIQYNANCDLVMGGHHVQMRNVVQWCIRDCDLRLTVAEEMAPEISNLLSATKQNPTIMCEAHANSIIDAWCLTTSPPLSETLSAMTLLTHRVNQICCSVANFPLPPAPPTQPLQECAGISVGDVVEVMFEGEWFKGTVKVIESDGVAQVHCDVDPPEVLTKTPLSFLRHPVNHGTPEVIPHSTCDPATQEPKPKISYDPATPARAVPPVAKAPSAPQPPPPQEGIQNSISNVHMLSEHTKPEAENRKAGKKSFSHARQASI